MTPSEKEILIQILENRIKMETIMEIQKEIYSIIGKDQLDIDQIEKDVRSKISNKYKYGK